MSTSWVAASVRARALAHRRIGGAGTRELAASPTLERALTVLADSPYGRDVHHGQSLPEAQHAVASTLLWHIRVLAGWLPRGDARFLRVLAGGFEVANVDERLREIAGGAPEPPFRLGGLSTTWTALAGATSAEQMRTLLARSVWGDPGVDNPDGIRLAMRLAWAGRVSANVPRARAWAVGAATLMIARPHLLDDRPMPASTALLTTRLLGTHWQESRTLTGFVSSLPADARWPLESIDDPADLWRAEASWWARVAADGFALLRQPVGSPDPVIGAVAVLATDAWRVRAALEVATRGGISAPGGLEAFDAVA